MKITPKRILAGVGAAMTATIMAVVMFTDSSVQGMINSANCGDIITLEAGKTYVENITLPVKQCTGFITIQSSRASELPEGKRVTPAQAPLLAWLQSNVNAEPVIKTAPGAHHYKFIGIRASTINEGVFVYDVVRLGGGRDTQKTVAEAPHHIDIDRSYIHGWPTQDVLRGVAANCGECSVTNSHIDDIHWVGIEAQAIDAWNGPGPFRFNNNFLAAAGQSIMIGGADSAIPELMPANGEIRRNHMFKPLAWKAGHPTYAGKHWTVKNGLEFKVGINWVVDGNVIENVWVDAQDGSIVLLTVRNQECSAPWSTIQNVTITNNLIIGADGAALNLLGEDNEATVEYVTAHPDKCDIKTAKLGSVRGSGVTVSNNLFHGIKGAFLQLNGFNNVSIDHNTHLQGFSLMTLFGQQSTGFKYTNNLTQDRDYCIFGDGGTQGVDALAKFAPGAVVTANVIAGPRCTYPSGNTHPASLTLPADFRSSFPNAGANIDTLRAAQSGVVSPTPSPTVQPSVSPSPTATATIAPSPSPTSQPIPSPTATPLPTSTPTPQPTPTPCPTPQAVPICRSNQVVGNPPTCLCRGGMRGDRCK